jgi:hypothetical protein
MFPVFFVVGIFALSVLVPQDWFHHFSLCYYKTVTGLDCPGCGLTRAFSLLFKGHFREAMGMNAMAPVLVLWLGVYALREIYKISTGHRPAWFTPQGNRVISRLFLVLFLGQWTWKTLLSLGV